MDVINEFEGGGKSVFFKHDTQGYQKSKNIVQALQAAALKVFLYLCSALILGRFWAL